MDYQLIKAIEEQLRIWNAKLLTESAQLEHYVKYKNMRLVSSSPKNGYTSYYVVERGKVERRYVPQNSEIVQGIKMAHHLERSIELTKQNIIGLERYLSSHNKLDFDSVDQGLKKIYQDSLKRQMIPPNEKAAAWLERKTRFIEKFNQVHPDKYPEDLKIQASDGRWMRSKAETQIADLANARGLVNIYELPHYCDGIWIKSDLTILSPIDWETEFVFEHEGLLKNLKYQSTQMNKKTHYMEEGYKPNINLFYSYDYFDGTFSLAPINHFFDIIMTSVPPKSFIQRLHPDDELTLELEIKRHELFK